jgi:hypothetical protein
MMGVMGGIVGKNAMLFNLIKYALPNCNPRSANGPMCFGIYFGIFLPWVWG